MIQKDCLKNIKLNIFGKENLNFLISEPNFKKFMMRCLTNTDTGYIQLMDKIYFNKAHPENMAGSASAGAATVAPTASAAAPAASAPFIRSSSGGRRSAASSAAAGCSDSCHRTSP